MLRTGVCETLMPDVVAPEAHQNNRSYVSSAFDPLRKNLAGWAVTRRTSKKPPTKLGRALVLSGRLPGTIR